MSRPVRSPARSSPPVRTGTNSRKPGPHMCRWGFCTQTCESVADRMKHMLEHVRKAQPERLGDLEMRRRVEEGIGDSFSSGIITGSFPLSSELERRINESQDSAGAASLPSPPVTLTPELSPSHPHIPYNDHLERSYRSPSPTADPLPESESPFLFNQEGSYDELFDHPPEDDLFDHPAEDDPNSDWTSGIRTPTFADLSSSLAGSPVQQVYDPPSPSLSALIDGPAESRTKRKSPHDGFDEEEEDEAEGKQDEGGQSQDQSSISSSESRQQVEDQLTQSLELEEDEVHDRRPNSNDVSIPTPSDPAIPEPAPFESSSNAPHSPDAPRKSLYPEPRVPHPYTVPQIPAPQFQKQSWYMPAKRIRSRGQRSSGARSSSVQSPVDDHFSICQSQAQTQAYDSDPFMLMSQAPYDSQAYGD
ncbi:hypothetical protein V5O48_007991 [Marasmius crinis-equi]|uniref:C2H2-type domain-containing protein n=1 Tax=Marasmius crinis-equi TaxID=585013 RepID=A0ABR3FFB0_9AGAR